MGTRNKRIVSSKAYSADKGNVEIADGCKDLKDEMGPRL
jgi:hypothetical protein